MKQFLRDFFRVMGVHQGDLRFSDVFTYFVEGCVLYGTILLCKQDVE